MFFNISNMIKLVHLVDYVQVVKILDFFHFFYLLFIVRHNIFENSFILEDKLYGFKNAVPHSIWNCGKIRKKNGEKKRKPLVFKEEKKWSFNHFV
jgi:hypothetical protein